MFLTRSTHILWICLLITHLLVGCATPRAPRVIESIETTPDTTQGKTTKIKPGQATSGSRSGGGGGYYKDDGPGDDIPDNLDSVPDATPRAEPLHRGANRPYIALGQAYTPNTSIVPYQAKGIASWYGRRYHGQKTSIGDTYDMFAMTAAHPTLAIPSYVRVTNPDNGKKVVVRVNDRGPFHSDRLIDLSYTAAWKLGIIGKGSGRVEVEAIVLNGTRPPESNYTSGETLTPQSASPTPPAPPTPSQLQLLASEELSERSAPPKNSWSASSGAAKMVFIQVGAFSSEDNAQTFKNRLAHELVWVTSPMTVEVHNGVYRVLIGPFISRAKAVPVAERITSEMGFRPIVR